MTPKQVISISKSTDGPHLTHLAAINRVVDAEGLHGEVAITKCGLAIRWFSDVTETGDNYTDGTQFKLYCKRCFPR